MLDQTIITIWSTGTSVDLDTCSLELRHPFHQCHVPDIASNFEGQKCIFRMFPIYDLPGHR